MKVAPESIWSDLCRIRQTSPLIHNITNFVAMNNTANALLALGASPVMAHAQQEVEDMVKISGALVINIGTLSHDWIMAMGKAMLKAKQLAKLVVLDPVGAGATQYRTETVFNLMKAGIPTVIRGNASEIMAIDHQIDQTDMQTKGVDSTSSSETAIDAANRIYQKYKCVVCISGETDYIIEGEKMGTVNNGDYMMTKVTGLGCTASAICGAFLSVNPSSFTACIHAMTIMGIAGELGCKKADGPGSLQIAFLDCLYNLKEKDIIKYAKAKIL